VKKIIVLSFISLDGVMQAPGGPEEDTSGGFKYGGWTVPYFDDFSAKIMSKQMGQPFDLLLGRKTYDIFAAYWPEHGGEIGGVFDRATKYVISRTNHAYNWKKTVVIRDNIVSQIKKLKEGKGPNLQVHGSGNLIQTLLKNNLIDELWLKIFPVTLGKGKKLFDKGTLPASFELLESSVSPKGVIIANYKREGKIKTGSF